MMHLDLKESETPHAFEPGHMACFGTTLPVFLAYIPLLTLTFPVSMLHLLLRYAPPT